MMTIGGDAGDGGRAETVDIASSALMATYGACKRH